LRWWRIIEALALKLIRKSREAFWSAPGAGALVAVEIKEKAPGGGALHDAPRSS
jgi:hypothetical protein